MKLKKLTIDKGGNIFLDGQQLENIKEYSVHKEMQTPAEITLTVYVKIGEIADLEDVYLGR